MMLSERIFFYIRSSLYYVQNFFGVLYEKVLRTEFYFFCAKLLFFYIIRYKRKFWNKNNTGMETVSNIIAGFGL